MFESLSFIIILLFVTWSLSLFVTLGSLHGQ